MLDLITGPPNLGCHVVGATKHCVDSLRDIHRVVGVFLLRIRHTLGAELAVDNAAGTIIFHRDQLGIAGATEFCPGFVTIVIVCNPLLGDDTLELAFSRCRFILFDGDI